MQFLPDREERGRKGTGANGLLVRAAKELAGIGLNMEIVSGAGTGTYDIAAEFAEMTEIQAGSYIFMDGTYQNCPAALAVINRNGHGGKPTDR